MTGFTLRNARAGRMRWLLRHGLSLGIFTACAILLSQRLQGLDLAALTAGFNRVSALQWGVAGLATGVSFLAVARYDVIAHRHFATGCAPARAMLSGASAIALGQILGAGAVVGSLVRWRMLPDLSLGMAARLSLFVTATFLAALLVTLALVSLLLPNALFPAWLGLLLLLAAFAGGVFAFFRPVLQIGRYRLSLPSLPALATLFFLCLLDTVMAGFALYTLLPPAVALSFAVFLPAFLVALGAAILSGTPGGVGPFELSLLALLPGAEETTLLASILAFRILYYALPAITAAVLLLRRPPSKSSAPTPPELRAPIPLSRAELGILRQNGGSFGALGSGFCGLVTTGQTLTALFDPCATDSASLVVPLRRMAQSRNRIPCAYKITARNAAHLRRAGWAVLHVADEALIDTAAHDLQGPAYRQLRRKLRHAEAALHITAPSALPLADMAETAALWERAHGPARGLTMGRFDPIYIKDQAVFLAWQGHRLAGFISLHRAPHEWCLDLMRARPDAPDGTMHALIHAAIRAAHTAGVPHLSLAAVPALPANTAPPEAHLRRLMARASGGNGLRQFKTSFAPRWQPLYMAAPTRPQLALAACDLARAIRAAPPPNTPPPHNQHEEKCIAPLGLS